MHAPTNTSLLLSSLLLFKYPTGITRVAYSADNKKHTVPGAVDYIIRIYIYVCTWYSHNHTTAYIEYIREEGNHTTSSVPGTQYVLSFVWVCRGEHDNLSVRGVIYHTLYYTKHRTTPIVLLYSTAEAAVLPRPFSRGQNGWECVYCLSNTVFPRSETISIFRGGSIPDLV